MKRLLRGVALMVIGSLLLYGENHCVVDGLKSISPSKVIKSFEPGTITPKKIKAQGKTLMYSADERVFIHQLNSDVPDIVLDAISADPDVTVGFQVQEFGRSFAMNEDENILVVGGQYLIGCTDVISRCGGVWVFEKNDQDGWDFVQRLNKQPLNIGYDVAIMIHKFYNNIIR